MAELPVTTQFDTTQLVVDSHQSPPPPDSRVGPSTARVAPLVRVKPVKLAPLVRYTHRIAPSPLPSPKPPPSRRPWMMVNCGPLTLRSASGLSTATRLV